MVSAADSAGYLVESALGGYSSGLFAEWGKGLPVEFDAVDAASLLPDHPNVWTDGSLVLDRVTGVSFSGAGFFAHQPVACWDHRRWGHVDQVRPVGDFQSCKGFCSVPGLLQSGGVGRSAPKGGDSRRSSSPGNCSVGSVTHHRTELAAPADFLTSSQLHQPAPHKGKELSGH